jgi:hypothetical protein
MATTSTSTAVAAAEPVFTEPERLALAGYTGLTREAYALDLRQYASWCQQRHLRLFQARRAEIECFARDLEAQLWVIVPTAPLPAGMGNTASARRDRRPGNLLLPTGGKPVRTDKGHVMFTSPHFSTQLASDRQRDLLVDAERYHRAAQFRRRPQESRRMIRASRGLLRALSRVAPRGTVMPA